jgi:DNA-binding CsgD family transcriptional regulator
MLVLALGTGLITIMAAALVAQSRRTMLFRALLANIALFNLLILGGLVFLYQRMHIPELSPVPFLAGLSVVKVAWLYAFASTVRLLGDGNRIGPFARRAAGAAIALLAIHWGLLAVGWYSGRAMLLQAGVALAELTILGGAAAAAVWLLRRARRVAGSRRASLTWFAGFHLALFGAMTVGLLTVWLLPQGTADNAITASKLMMIAYNLFPLLWLRRFEPPSPSSPAAEFDRYGITPREREVIELICAGSTNQEIADRLFISVATVKDHNHNIFRKTNVRNRVELVNLFRPARVQPTK